MPDVAQRESPCSLDRALSLLGPLEQRIMRAVWSGQVLEPFTVRDVRVLIPALAYTTIMTTVNRLADKGLLSVERVATQRAHRYVIAESPEVFLTRSGREQVERVMERFGEAAVAAFTEHLDKLTPEQLDRLRAVVNQ